MDVSRKQVVRLASRWISESTPAAVVRFGEGEGRLLTADPSDPESIRVAANKLRRQTGLTFSPDEVFKVKSLVMNAFDEADVVGIRGSASFNAEHTMWVERIEREFEARVANGRKPAYVAHCLINNNLRDALASMLEGRRRVTVISCRDIKARIQEDYGIEEVTVHQVPSQYITRLVDDEYEAALHDVPIWPDFYNRLRVELSVRERGEVFLVGAGILGKQLCVQVKELGGIALDLGSCLDGMADKVTRGANRPEPYRQ